MRCCRKRTNKWGKEKMAGINISLEVFSILLSFLLFCSCLAEAMRKKNVVRRIFTAMLIVNCLVLISDMITWIFEGAVEYTVFLYACNFLVYSLGYVITGLYTWYLVFYISEKKRVPVIIGYIVSALCLIAVLLVVISLFNHMYFRFEDGIYMRGKYYWISQIYPVFILFFNMIIVFHYRKQLGVHDTMALLSYGVLPICAMLIQIALYGITLLYISTTFSLLIIFISIHVKQGRNLSRREEELKSANISLMVSQIQPHFLTNLLTAI